VIEGMLWRLNKKKTVEWMERKEREFSRKENKKPQRSDEQCLQRYVFTELHDIFFGEFTIILTKWLDRLVENTRRYRTTTPRNWTPEFIRQLNFVSNKTSHTIISG
jgi:hypothetical protein